MADVIWVWGIEVGLFVLLVASLEAERPAALAAAILALALCAGVAWRASRLRARVARLFEADYRASLGGLAVLALAFPVVLRTSPYWIFVGTMALLYVIIGQGLNLQLGTAGVINLAGAAFSGLGAYTAALLATRWGVPGWLTLGLGPLAAVVVGALLFVPILKTRGHYLALVTIAFVFIFNTLVNNLDFTGGPQGIKNIPTLSLFGYAFTTAPRLGGITLPFHANFFYAALILAALVTFLLWRLLNSWTGLALNTLRDDEVAAKCSGVRVTQYKLVAFSLGNFIIGLAGALYALMVGFVSPPDFTFSDSLVMVSVIILGGLDSLPGIVLGAGLLVALPERFRFLHEYRLLLYGGAILAMLLFRPKGLWPAGIRRYGLREAPRRLAGAGAELPTGTAAKP